MKLLALGLAVVSLGCVCGDPFSGTTEGPGDGICESYPKSYLEGCRSTCDKAKTALECETSCATALQTDETYKRCLEQ